MSTDEHKRAFIRPHRRLSASGQITAANANGYSIHYVVGQDVDDWPEYAQQVDDGDECGIARLVLFVSPSVKPARARRAELQECVRQIEDAGGVICEWETGRKTSNRDDRDAMIADAWEAIASGHLVPKRGTTLGRPRKTFSDRDWKRAERVWFDKRLATWDDVAAKLPDGMSPRDCWRRFGRREK